MRLLGYTRERTATQNARLQLDALTDAGVEPSDVFCDLTGDTKRASALPGLRRALQTAEAGDILVVWRIDCLGQSLFDVLSTVATLNDRGVNLRSLQDHIDPWTTNGRLILDLLAALPEYERILAAERRSAREARTARQAYAKVGRPPIDPDAIRAKLHHIDGARARGLTAAQAAQLVGWSRATFYRHQRHVGTQP